MTQTRLDLSDETERLLVRGMQLALLGVVFYGLATASLGMVSNGVVALAITLLPALLRREYGYSMDVRLVFWLTAAVFLHSVGSLGPYSWFPWYDNVTHTVSAMVAAGFGYASFRALELHSDEVDVPAEFRAVFIVVFVLAVGVVWEIGEFATEALAHRLGVRPPLVVGGIDDIVTDMIFNTVGAVIVAVAGTDYVGDLVGFFGRLLGRERGG